MSSQRLATNLAFFQKAIPLAFLAIPALNFSEDAAQAVEAGFPAAFGPAFSVTLCLIFAISLLAITLAGLMTSPLARVIIVLSGVQLGLALVLFHFVWDTLLSVATMAVALIAATTLAVSIYRWKEAAQLPKSTRLPRRPGCGILTLVALHVMIGLGVLVMGLGTAFRIEGLGFPGGAAGEPVTPLTYLLSTALLSFGIGALLLTPHAARALLLTVVQFTLCLPLALFLIISSYWAWLSALAVIVTPAITFFLCLYKILKPGDLSKEIPADARAAAIARTEEEIATWESPTLWSSRYLGFQLAVFLLAGIQILLAVVLAAIWYQLEHQGSPIPQGDAGTIALSLASDQRIGLAINFAAALALGCFLLSPWPRISLVLGLLQTFIVLTLQPLGDGFGLTQIIILPLAIVSVALSIWREHLDPPGLAD